MIRIGPIRHHLSPRLVIVDRIDHSTAPAPASSGYAAISTANGQGRLGLILYSIPMFPDPKTYRQIIDLLNARNEVSVVETTFPVTDQFSPYANALIQGAHRAAAKHAAGRPLGEMVAGIEKPTICVLYRQTHGEMGLAGVLDAAGGALDGLLFEWAHSPSADERAAAEAHGVELIPGVFAGVDAEETRSALATSGAGPLVYYVSAAMTGAALFDDSRLQATLRHITAARPQARIAAGFGIRTADDVRRMGRLEGLHCVIVGTAFLEACARGVEAVEAFLDEICPALTWKRS